jgi:Ca2+:H+ antiporter
MCFFWGGMYHPEQKFISQGAVAFMAMLGVAGLTLLMPQFFSTNVVEDLQISRSGAVLLILLYCKLLYFQLSTHVHLFTTAEEDDDGQPVALIPFSWALLGMVLLTCMVTILSEWLVGSIDGFCVQFGLSHAFVGVIVLPVVGNAVEHISAVTVAMKNKMDLALGGECSYVCTLCVGHQFSFFFFSSHINAYILHIFFCIIYSLNGTSLFSSIYILTVALGSSVQIALFVLPMVVVIGWITGRDMTLRFPPMQVYLYLLSTFIVSLVLSNQRSNWLEGSMLIFTYIIIAIGIYHEVDE